MCAMPKPEPILTLARAPATTSPEKLAKTSWPNELNERKRADRQGQPRGDACIRKYGPSSVGVADRISAIGLGCLAGRLVARPRVDGGSRDVDLTVSRNPCIGLTLPAATQPGERRRWPNPIKVNRSAGLAQITCFT